jgi:serine/threonine protein kinase
MGDAKRCRWCGADLPHEETQPTCDRCRMSETLLRFSGGAPSLPRTAPEEGCDLEEGVQFGEYRLLSTIASGGMGCVYRAHHRRLNRMVALKKMLPELVKDGEQIRRFHTEAEAAAALSHPNIVPVYEAGECNDEHFFTMALVEGQDLGRELRTRSFAAEEAARYVHKAALGIHHAHQRGVLHRDLKPSNIILDQRNEPQIADFGIAKLRDTREESLQTSVVGTPHYMAPEQAQPWSAQVSVATDVYGLGAILYHLLTGRPPFTGDSAEEILWSVYYDDPVRPSVYNPKVPKDLEFICLKCLQKGPEERYASAEAVAEDLQRFLEHKPLVALPASPVRQCYLWVSRNPVTAILILLLSIAVCSGAAIQRAALEKVRSARAASETIIGFMNDGLSRDLREVGRLDLMEKINAHAEQYYTNYTAVGDSGFWERKALFYENTASVEKEMGNLTRAEDAAKNADALYGKIHADEPSKTHALVRRSYVQILRCHIAKEAGQLLLAEEFASSALMLAQAAIKANSGNPTNHAALAFALLEQASLWLEREQTDKATANIDLAESTLQSVVKALNPPPEWWLWLANCNYYRGIADHARGNAGSALLRFNGYLEAIRQLVQGYSQNTRSQYELSVAYARVGQALFSLGQFQAADSFYKWNEDHAASLVSADPRNAVWQSLYGRSLWWRGYLAETQQASPAVIRGYWQAALTIQSNLVYRNPDCDPWSDDLANTIVRLAKAHESEGDVAQAQVLLADWRAQCRRYAVQNPEHFGHQRRWGDAIVEDAQMRAAAEGTANIISLLQEGLAELKSVSDSPFGAAAEARVRSRLASALIAGNPLVGAVELQEALGLRLALFEKVPHYKILRGNIANNFRWTVKYLIDAGATNEALQLAEDALDWAATRLYPEEYRRDFGEMAVQALRVLASSDPKQGARAQQIARRCLAERLTVPPPLAGREEMVKQQLHESLLQGP